ncbi:hypothetical protein [uncultured Pseudokineococcus sp.]|uniref:hypothetical protein n=1 Tax=uncultured Pseudokineococcus sp. TaxID=1642928 RepID=UPI00261EF2AA|nr:hypothetical protein [uncultured Pseudokineococcus sp.]
MTSSPDPRRTWSTGLALLGLAALLGLLVTLVEPPLWASVAVLVVMLVLVTAGGASIRRRDGGWRPSETHGDPPR